MSVWTATSRRRGEPDGTGRTTAPGRGRVCGPPAAAAVATAALLLLLGGPARAEVEPQSSCVACHQNPDFLVQNKKLYEYFQNWRSSIHAQEGVSCHDCHGGNPERADKAGAHGSIIAPDVAGSAVNFRHISQLCGGCHSDILAGFRKSRHFQHIVAEKQEKQGPTCVTCHRSMNTEILNVSSVRESCARCHNDATHNHPENPEKAELILGRFLSIHRLYRYITKNADPEEAQAFLGAVDPKLHDLSVTWHTFDLAEIERKADAVLAELRAKRSELRERRARATEAEAGAR